jgi:hypothetical protein
VTAPEDAVLAVLGAAGEPLHWTVVLDRALREGLLDPFTTPDVRGEVQRALRALAARGRVVRVTTGVWTLPGEEPAAATGGSRSR